MVAEVVQGIKGEAEVEEALGEEATRLCVSFVKSQDTQQLSAGIFLSKIILLLKCSRSEETHISSKVQLTLFSQCLELLQPLFLLEISLSTSYDLGASSSWYPDSGATHHVATSTSVLSKWRIFAPRKSFSRELLSKVFTIS
ncbi:uncharacterized protein LOC125217143 [Salvia hispanica]|uniref:uncharacterized protein LOC125217143 n=1 Tax=Salvia hispanica TaxID=49212 RepID=UPI0020093E89|nr:uncharacterized protein LOC125217143 [Salvia hispanica]